MSEKTLRRVPIRDFVDELLKRIEEAQTIDCCKDEIRKFCEITLQHIPDETIEIEWKD